MRLFTLCATLICLATPALAQQGRPAETPEREANRKHDFGDPQAIGGNRVGPSGSYQLAKPRAEFDCRIRERKSFADKLDESVDAL